MYIVVNVLITDINVWVLGFIVVGTFVPLLSKSTKSTDDESEPDP